MESYERVLKRQPLYRSKGVETYRTCTYTRVTSPSKQASEPESFRSRSAGAKRAIASEGDIILNHITLTSTGFTGYVFPIASFFGVAVLFDDSNGVPGAATVSYARLMWILRPALVDCTKTTPFIEAIQCCCLELPTAMTILVQPVNTLSVNRLLSPPYILGTRHTAHSSTNNTLSLAVLVHLRRLRVRMYGEIRVEKYQQQSCPVLCAFQPDRLTYSESTLIPQRQACTGSKRRAPLRCSPRSHSCRKRLLLTALCCPTPHTIMMRRSHVHGTVRNLFRPLSPLHLGLIVYTNTSGATNNQQPNTRVSRILEQNVVIHAHTLLLLCSHALCGCVPPRSGGMPEDTAREAQAQRLYRKVPRCPSGRLR